MKVNYPFATVCLVLLLLLTFAFVSLYPFPKPIDVERTAIIFTEDDPASAIPTTLKIRGTLHRPLFAQDKFSGKLTIAALSFTEEDETLDVIVTKKEHGINMGSLWYQGKSSPQNVSQPSLIWFDNDFNELSIWMSSNWLDNENKNSFLVTAPTYDQALAIQKSMSEAFGEPFVRDK